MYRDGAFLVDVVVKHVTDRRSDVDAETVKQDFNLCIESHKDETDNCDEAYAVIKCFMAKYGPPRRHGGMKRVH